MIQSDATSFLDDVDLRAIKKTIQVFFSRLLNLSKSFAEFQVKCGQVPDDIYNRIGRLMRLDPDYIAR